MYFKQKQLDGSYTIFESDLNFDVDIATKLTDTEIQSYLLSKAKQTKLTELENYYKNSNDLRNLFIVNQE